MLGSNECCLLLPPGSDMQVGGVATHALGRATAVYDQDESFSTMLLVTGSAQVMINLKRERILLHNTSWALFAFTAHAHPGHISDDLPELPPCSCTPLYNE